MKCTPTTEMDLSKIDVGKINAANWPKLNIPFEEDEVNNPNHYKGAFGLEAIDVVRNFAGDLSGECHQVSIEIPRQERFGRFEESQKKSGLVDRGDGGRKCRIGLKGLLS